MGDASEPRVSPEDTRPKYSAGKWQILWFLLHLAAVYAIVKFFTPSLAGWTWGTLLPLLQRPPSSSRFEFLFSHILAFSFLPALIAGLVNARFKHMAAQFVWVLPALILAYKFATFPAPSVLQSQSAAAFRQYFGGGFTIRAFRDWREFWAFVATSSDMARGMAQLQYTAPFYAGVAYSVGAWTGRRTELSRKVMKKVGDWERSRFGHQS